jgi:hypothetical protein
LLKEWAGPGPALVKAALRLDEFAGAVLEGNLRAALPAARGRKLSEKVGPDLIEFIAQTLSDHAHGLERNLLSKSLQEALFEIVGDDFEIRLPRLEAVLARFLAGSGRSSLLRRFLSLHLFNAIWYQTGESFRVLARTPRAFSETVEEIELICRRTVSKSWRSQHRTPFLNQSSAERLITSIERRLRNF